MSTDPIEQRHAVPLIETVIVHLRPRFPSQTFICSPRYHSGMIPTNHLQSDTWIDRLWREYINLRKIDLSTKDKEPSDTNPAQNPSCYSQTGHSR